jgi:hypothetical protein
MDFPLKIAGHIVANAPALASLVLDDARAGGGTVIPGQRPSAWLAAAVAEGLIARRLAIGLAAALLQLGDPAGLVEAAELGARLGAEELGPVLRAAVDALDVGVLLERAPGAPDASVEDALLRGWAALAPADDPAALRALLERLRNAGLRDLELRALAERGSAELIAELLPFILVEELPASDVDVLARAIARGPDEASAIMASASTLPVAQRRAIVGAATALGAADSADLAVWVGDQRPSSTVGS